jgi:hypothetical protein
MRAFLLKWANLKPDTPVEAKSIPLVALQAVSPEDAKMQADLAPMASITESKQFEESAESPAPVDVCGAECLHGISWADWKAAMLNRLFQEKGSTGQPGRITAATVRDGESKQKGRRQHGRQVRNGV